MKKLTVNSISKNYEQLYKSFLETSSPDESFYAVNNAMIFAFFLKFINLEYTPNLKEECYEKIVDKYGIDIFFHNIKKTNKYKENRDLAIDKFVALFGTDSSEELALEKVLGNVLERHVNRKDTGSYYTPEDTTRYISERAILISLLNKCDKDIKDSVCEYNHLEKPINIIDQTDDVVGAIKNALDDSQKERFINELYKLKIIDPTCGSGAFIVAAFECLEKLISNLGKEVNYDCLLKCLYGLDISKEAVQLTKLRMLMRIVNKKCDLALFAKTFDSNFVVEDAVVGSDYVIEEQGFDWKSFGCQFDCIIGNPPYVEARGYASENFVTQRCGNLYAYVIERACNIASANAMISFIVPLPFVATPRMQSAKNYLESNSNNVYYGTFADRPGCIFTGVHQRLTIFFAELGNSENCNCFSSAYNYWYNEERKSLFENIKYYPNGFKGILPKIGNDIECKIYQKLISGENSLMDLWEKETKFSIYMSTRIGFWAKAFDKNVFSSKEYKEYKLADEKTKYFALAVLNSSTFYYFWVITSDCWHVTNGNIEDLKFNSAEIEQLDYCALKECVDRLMKDLEDNKKYIGSKQTAYEYKHKYSKGIIDELDDMLAPVFGLDQSEVDYIKAYTEKYRVNNLEA